jgi:hypothetical protein
MHNDESGDTINQTTKAELQIHSVTQVGQLTNLKRGMKTTVGYRTQEEWLKLEGVSQLCFFLGFKEIPNDDGEVVQCAVLQDQREVFLSAQMILIDALKVVKVGTPVEIIYKGKKKNKTGGGSTNLFEVFTLTEGE